MRGDDFEYWTGIVTGLARMGIVSRGGKAASFAGLTAGAWFGEGSVLKNEPRRYDVMALRDTRLALMDRSTFVWLFENSVGVQPLPGPTAQRAARPVHRRSWNMAARWMRPRGWRARSPRCSIRFSTRKGPRHLEITQEEIGALSGISRQNANQCLKRLEKDGLLRLEYGGVTMVDLERLRDYGE